jgi:sugar phosphate isomerase/epimerase
MRIGGFELPWRWADDQKTFEADLKQAGLLLEICTALGADRCCTTIRPTSDERPFHENFQFHVDRLRQVADTLATANVKLALQFSATPADRADGGFQFIYQADPLLLLLNSIQRDNVGVLLDAWHWFVGGGDLDKVRSLRPEQILSVRLADIPSGTDLATITAEQRAMPGEGGTIDSAALVAVLEEMGCDGPIAVAPSPMLFKGQTRESIVSKASAALDAVLGGAAAEKPEAAAAK